MKERIICKLCKKKEVVKQGYRKTKNRGELQKYYCKGCKKYFTFDDGSYRMRNNPNNFLKIPLQDFL